MLSAPGSRHLAKLIAVLAALVLVAGSMNGLGLLLGVGDCCAVVDAEQQAEQTDDCCAHADADGPAVDSAPEHDHDSCPCPLPCAVTCRTQVPGGVTSAMMIELGPNLTELAPSLGRPDRRPSSPEPADILHVPKPFRS